MLARPRPSWSARRRWSASAASSRFFRPAACRCADLPWVLALRQDGVIACLAEVSHVWSQPAEGVHVPPGGGQPLGTHMARALSASARAALRWHTSCSASSSRCAQPPLLSVERAADDGSWRAVEAAEAEAAAGCRMSAFAFEVASASASPPGRRVGARQHPLGRLLGAHQLRGQPAVVAGWEARAVGRDGPCPAAALASPASVQPLCVTLTGARGPRRRARAAWPAGTRRAARETRLRHRQERRRRRPTRRSSWRAACPLLAAPSR